MFNYAGSASTAKSLLTNFGRTLQHVSVSEGVYDPDTTTMTNTETSTDCVGCDFDFKASMYESGLVQAGDRYALVDNSVSNIDVSDQLIIGSVRWTITKVEKIAPAGVLVMWKCHIRK